MRRACVVVSAYVLAAVVLASCHSSTVRSPVLEFRLVRSDHGSHCVRTALNPSRYRPLSLDTLDGRCVTLAPASLDAFDYAVTRGQHYDDSGYPVYISLSARSDVAAFARLTRGAMGRELGVVIGGRLLTAPSIESTITDGQIQISAPSEKVQDEIMNALTG